MNNKEPNEPTSPTSSKEDLFWLWATRTLLALLLLIILNLIVVAGGLIG